LHGTGAEHVGRINDAGRVLFDQAGFDGQLQHAFEDAPAAVDRQQPGAKPAQGDMIQPRFPNFPGL